MIAYENDVLTIPKKYKKMSVSELEREKARLLKEIKASVSQKKQVRTNKKAWRVRRICIHRRVNTFL